MREAIKDEELAAEIRHAEDSGLDAFETRRKVREAIERRYTAPAELLKRLKQWRPPGLGARSGKGGAFDPSNRRST